MYEELVPCFVVVQTIKPSIYCYYVGARTEKQALAFVRSHTDNQGNYSVLRSAEDVNFMLGDVRKITRAMTKDPDIRARLLLNDTRFGIVDTDYNKRS